MMYVPLILNAEPGKKCLIHFLIDRCALDGAGVFCGVNGSMFES